MNYFYNIVDLMISLLLLFSLAYFLKRKFNVKMEFSVVLSISFVICFLYIVSLVNLLFVGYVALCLFCLILFIYYLIKDRDNFLKNYCTKSILICLLLIFILSLTLAHIKILHFDNFSHWLVIVSQIIHLNNLPDASNILTTYYDYPPGSAYFIYFVSSFNSDYEYMAILSQTSLEILLLLPLFVFAKNNFQYIISSILIVFFLVIDISVADLLVDSLLGIFAFSIFMFIYYYRNNLNKLLLFLIPLNLSLLLIKNVAIFFYFLEFLLLLIILFSRENTFKENIRSVGFFIIPIIAFALWRIRNKIVFYSIGFSSAQSVSMGNYSSNLSEKSIDVMIQIVKKFIKTMVDYHNLFVVMFIVLLILSIAFCIVNKPSKKNIFKYFGFILLCYFGYSFFLLAAYFVSMTTYEAVNLASFNRYFTTIMFLIIGISIIIYFNKNKDSILLDIIICVCLLFCIFTSSNSLHLIGIRDDKDSTRTYVENVIGDYKKNNDKVLVISPKSSEDGLISFCTTYFLQSRDYRLISNTKELEGINIENYDAVVVYETDDYVVEFMKNINNFNNKAGVYKVGENND